MKTIVTEIEQIEKDLAKYEERLEAIERLGRLTDMSNEEWTSLKHEKKMLEKKVLENRKTLKGLRWENWKSMVVSVLLLGFGYLVFTLAFQSSPSSTISSS